ncbi:hypothetical protein DL767_009901 [Monosporascus sp. MG133]|nr:hypothetical protein DL767_009901 [Monosporascus sp. MG133]
MIRFPEHICVIDKASKSSEKCILSRDGSKIMVEVPASLYDIVEAVVETLRIFVKYQTSSKAKTKSGKANNAEEEWVSAKSAFEEAYGAYKEKVGIDPLTANMQDIQFIKDVRTLFDAAVDAERGNGDDDDEDI